MGFRFVARAACGVARQRTRAASVREEGPTRAERGTGADPVAGAQEGAGWSVERRTSRAAISGGYPARTAAGTGRTTDAFAAPCSAGARCGKRKGSRCAASSASQPEQRGGRACQCRAAAPRCRGHGPRFECARAHAQAHRGHAYAHTGSTTQSHARGAAHLGGPVAQRERRSADRCAPARAAPGAGSLVSCSHTHRALTTYRIRRQGLRHAAHSSNRRTRCRHWRQTTSVQNTWMRSRPRTLRCCFICSQGPHARSDKPYFPVRNSVTDVGHERARLALRASRFLNNLVLTIDYVPPNLPALFQPPVFEQRLQHSE